MTWTCNERKESVKMLMSACMVLGMKEGWKGLRLIVLEWLKNVPTRDDCCFLVSLIAIRYLYIITIHLADVARRLAI